MTDFSFPSEMSTPIDTTDYKDPKACLELKTKHDLCFHKWMREKFMPGLATQDDCKQEWEEYQVCVEVRFNLFYSTKRTYIHILTIVFYLIVDIAEEISGIWPHIDTKKTWTAKTYRHCCRT
jgi:hypothetical protein